MTPDPNKSEALKPIERLLAKILHRAYSTNYREKGHVCDFRQAVESIVQMIEAFLDERAACAPDRDAECAAMRSALEEIAEVPTQHKDLARLAPGLVLAYERIAEKAIASTAGTDLLERLAKAVEERDALKAELHFLKSKHEFPKP